MTHGRSFRGEAGSFVRTGTRVAAAVLVISATFAAIWATPAASASGSRMQSLASGSSRHAKVKYYIVPQPGHGPPVALYGIAVRTLGDSRRYIEIFNLNKGRRQPNGGRLENPHTIDPGWILQLPADASGPGVHFGRLPGRRPSATPPASPGPSQPAASGTAARSKLKPSGTGSAFLVGGALIVLAIAGLAFGISRRRAGAARRRKHSYLAAPVHQDSSRTGAAATAPDIHAIDPRWQGENHPSWPGSDPSSPGANPGRPAADHPSWPGANPRQPAAEHPSWPGAGPRQPAGDPRRPNADPRWPGANPGRPAADHPSWPGANPRQPAADHPSWPGASPRQPAGDPRRPNADPRWPGANPGRPAADHPSRPGANPRRPSADPRSPGAGPRWPAAQHPSWPGGDHPSFPQPAIRSGPRQDSSPEPPYDHRPQAASQAIGRQNPADNWGPPDVSPADPPDPRQQWSTQVARTAGQAYQPVAFGDGRLQVLLTEGRAVGWPGAAGLGARPEDLAQLAAGEAAQLADTIRQEAGEVRNAHSLWLAGRILSGAENQAAEIRQEAYEQAAALRATAEREAAEARQQAAATRATAAAEAAELLTTAKTMQSELGRVAAYVTESLTSPGLPITKPAARPGAKPGGRPAAKPTASPDAEPADSAAAEPAARPARPGTKPTARPGAKPSARPDAKPVTKQIGRQINAMRKMVIALVAVCLLGGIAGATEIGLHGFSFFLFRNAGAGAGNSRDLDENQGPGQPAAPGAQHKPHAGKPVSKTPASRPSSKPS